MRAKRHPPPKADAKERILEAAIFLMKQSGLTGAGINQVLARSNAPKGSIYYYFPQGKQQVAAEALTLYAQRVAAAFERVLASKRKPADKVRALFHFVADRLKEGRFEQSCAVGAVTLDLDSNVATLQPVIAATFASWRAIVASHLPIRSRARRESIAGLVISTIEGAYIRGRAERSKGAFMEAGKWLAQLVEKECDAGKR
jgi:TetR/AcrR family transcriptional repressor of lmrAB and yxaGH operons